MKNNEIKNSYSYSLDSFRLLAMITIFWNHCTFLKLNDTTNKLFEAWFHYGGVGVEFFIMLSGMLVGIFYINKKWKKDYIFSFYKKKAFRLFPLYWISLLLFLPDMLSAVSTKGVLGLGANGLSFLLLQSLTPKTWGFYNSPAWTISTLWIMYLLSPLFSKLLDKLNNRWLLISLVSLTITALVLNCRYYYSSQTSLYFFYISPYYRWVTFVQGMIIGRFVSSDFFTYGNCESSIKSIVELITIGLFVALFLVVKQFNNAGYFYSIYFMILLYIFFIGGGAISNLLSAKWLRKMSKLSYVFYLIHWFVVVNISNYVLFFYIHDYTVGNLMALFFTELAFTIALAILVNRYIEDRINVFLSK